MMGELGAVVVLDGPDEPKVICFWSCIDIAVIWVKGLVGSIAWRYSMGNGHWLASFEKTGQNIGSFRGSQESYNQKITSDGIPDTLRPRLHASTSTRLPLPSSARGCLFFPFL
jgi:hypothetical protein